MASAQNYLNSLKSPPPAQGGYNGGGYGEPTGRPLAPVPVDTYSGGFSPAQTPQGYSQSDDFAGDPNAPSWLRENAQAPPSTTAQAQYFDNSSATSGSAPSSGKRNCCSGAGPKFFSCLW
jgi:hypothetical protein